MSLFGFLKFGRQPDDDSPEIEPPLLPPPAAPGGDVAPPPTVVDFVAILEADGVNPEQRSRVIRAQELLRTLPADAPAPVKRNIVEAAFKAFDISTEDIVAAASGEMRALEAFIRRGEEQKQQTIADSERQIAELESRIAEVMLATERAVTEQDARAQATRDEMRKVEPVLQFFNKEQQPAAAPEPKAPEAAPPARGRPKADSVDIDWEPSQDAG